MFSTRDARISAGGGDGIGVVFGADYFIVMAEDAGLPSLLEFGLLLFRRRGGLIRGVGLDLVSILLIACRG